MKIHLDTDLGSDSDDACALAMLLGWPEVELTGITTTIDPGGRRAGYVTRCLELAGQEGVPLAAGAEVSMTTLTTPGDIPSDEVHWAAAVAPRPSSAGAALELLEQTSTQGATVLAIGPYTNLALLEVARPGPLAEAPVVLMGGWLGPPRAGLPAWGSERDWNVQCDTRAAEIVVRAVGPLTLVTLDATAAVHLRRAHLARLEGAGALGQLLQRQALAHAAGNRVDELARRYRGLPDDLLNFQHDPLAGVVAAGWSEVTAETLRLSPTYDDHVLSFVRDPEGREATVVLGADGPAFEELWLNRVEGAGRSL